MKRWLKKETPVTPPGISVAQRNQVKNRIDQQWNNIPTLEEMYKHIINYMLYDVAAPLRRMFLCEEIYPIVLEVYEEKFPEDFEEPEIESLSAPKGEKI